MIFSFLYCLAKTKSLIICPVPIYEDESALIKNIHFNSFV